MPSADILSDGCAIARARHSAQANGDLLELSVKRARGPVIAAYRRSGIPVDERTIDYLLKTGRSHGTAENYKYMA